MDSVGHEDKNELMKCFQCDLGFWDVCYTTKTICTLEERCFTGRGKAGLTKGMFFCYDFYFTSFYIKRTLNSTESLCLRRRSGHQDFGLCKSRGVWCGDHGTALH